MSIQIEKLTYEHIDREVLFENISFNIQSGIKATLTGNNGTGKSTLLRILAKQLKPKEGVIHTPNTPYYIPQHVGQYDDLSIYEALNVHEKINALHSILGSDTSNSNFEILNDDWEIEEKVKIALSYWNLAYIDPTSKLGDLSGGEKTKVFLAAIVIHQPEIILLDEPSNHLDYESRELLYKFIESHTATMLIVSHDKTILNLLSNTYEISKFGVKYYAGNYDYYKEQKEIEVSAQIARLENREKELRTATKMKQTVGERKQKLDARGEKRSAKKGIGKMAMDTRQDRAEASSSHLNDVHSKKMLNLNKEIEEIKDLLDVSTSMKVNFNSSILHKGKILANAKDINYKYLEQELWQTPLNFRIQSGERIVFKGLNGAGKTTLIKLLTKSLLQTSGELFLADFSYVHLNQEYSMIDNNLTVYEQAKQYASDLLEHEIKMNLNRFLFDVSTWDKLCIQLSGGEKMKLALCCLLLNSSQPDMIILDEPTNNIDLKNIEVLIACIKDYLGTIILVSHDAYFISQIGIDYEIELQRKTLLKRN